MQQRLDGPRAERRQRSIVGGCLGKGHQDIDRTFGMIRDLLVDLLPRPGNVVLAQTIGTVRGRSTPMVLPVRRSKFGGSVHVRIVPGPAPRRKRDRPYRPMVAV